MPYSSMFMPIGWNGLNMPLEEYSMSMPIIITNIKFRVVNITCPINDDDGYTY